MFVTWFLSHCSLSVWQAGRKTYAMVSGRSTGHSLASELVESNDGHEEIIKVSFPVYLHSSSFSPYRHRRGNG